MANISRQNRLADKPVVLLVTLFIFIASLFVQAELSTKKVILFVVGVGIGVTLYHAAFGFSGSWRSFIRERDGSGVRAQILLLGLTSILFFPVLGKVFPSVTASAALGPFGLSVLTGAFLFGIGMQLGGGCGSGTLYTVGGGHVRMLLTLAFFIVGAVIGSIHLPWWNGLPNLGKVSLIANWGWLTALLFQLVVLLVLYLLVRYLERKRSDRLNTVQHQENRPFVDKLIFGHWPLWWAIIGLALFNLLTLIIAGHPWSITFAFGLWGTKLWSALGGDISAWSYWQSGYPARALSQSVLADTTSLMNFGIILGSVLAAGLAGRFAPVQKYKTNDYVTAIVGGLLLGYGARLAFGCNIGALLAGISSGSLHGWLWLVAAFIGNVAGVQFRILYGIDKPMGEHS